MPEKPFRQGVVAVFINAKGELLVGRRYGTEAAWQFPQGGIDAGESPEEALRREVREEIGCQSFGVIRAVAVPIPYEFPADLPGKLPSLYRGQELFWFLCEFTGSGKADLSQASDEEFDALAWLSPQQVMGHITPWKYGAYQQGLTSLGLEVQ